MFYYVLTALLVLIGLGLVYSAFRLLSGSHWLLGWLRGMTGLLLVAAGFVVAMTAFDLLSYRQVLTDKPIATISFERLSPQHYRAILVDNAGRERRFDIAGDQWQLDARIIRWTSFIAGLGVKPAYKLDRLGGRYLSLDKERQSERSLHSLAETNAVGVDLWPLLQSASHWLPIEAQYGSATFLPMDDGALYGISMSSAGLVGRPLNVRAQEAVSRWQ